MTIYLSDSLMNGIEEARLRGYTCNFLYHDQEIIDRDSQKHYSMEQCKLSEYMRFEGLTDPGDSSILFLIECNDGKKGVLISAFGIYANQELLNFIYKLKKRKHEESIV